MTWDAWLSLAVVALVIGSLAFTKLAADVVLVGGVAVLLLAGVLTPGEALSGLSNEGMVTVGVLYVVAAGLRETGAIAWLVQGVLGRPKRLAGAQMRLMAPIMGLSAFLNNTPVVAMFLPAVNEWARRNRLPISKLLIPMSYAAILGGTCTLIGTSTNLIVNGLLVKETGRGSLGMFEIAWVALPCAAIGLIYLITVGRWLLPDRRPVMSDMDDPRQYTIEMLVEPASPLVGKTIEAAGLRHLPGMYLLEIERDGDILPAIAPHQRLQAGDQLVFVGIVDSVVDLQRFRGLLPAGDQVFKLDVPRPERCLMEAVVSDSCPIVGRSIREGRFRSLYSAAVIAVARNGERIERKIGDIVLKPGDTLLIEADPSFAERQHNSRDFFLVSQVPDSHPLRQDKAMIAIAILFCMVLAVTLEWLSMLQAAMLAAGFLLITRCINAGLARAAVDWQVLIAIAGSFGLGLALQKTGAAAVIAGQMTGLAQGDPLLSLAVVYLLTMLFTELITNNAAAVLMFPIGLSTSQALGVDFTPYAIAIMMAASASFSTPIGYQTNLMVYGPGGYRFSDYLRVGIPLNLMVAAITVTLAPLVWGF
ncbi:SLC13 family permease [Thiorhodococcus mannitoliphagus]|uniref:SLC13 family permease n=1 Tax=Thiorhodococcus mannitoliphagus TaxID=329406 RepID=A0A6P1DWX1_9GAMM|nr:SLC13 family permease [Thiorhodococcus mannitoliphagus]NEX21960.1 SLC13 family permease [Thiorhodococcus mannitoliphagus]